MALILANADNQKCKVCQLYSVYEKLIIIIIVFQQVDEKLINTFSKQIFHTGFVHADPHPGNGRLPLTYLLCDLKVVGLDPTCAYVLHLWARQLMVISY